MKEKSIGLEAAISIAASTEGQHGRYAVRGRPVLLPGLVLSAVLAVAGIELGKIGWFSAHGLSAPACDKILSIHRGP